MNDSTRRRDRVLSALSDGPATAAALAARIGAPVASIRRTVSSLRDAGFGITTTDQGYAHTHSPVSETASSL